jgi:TetR/AcrR family transcriptional repressor of nem operon
MPAKTDAAPSETAQRIVETAMALIQTRGYSAISYHDIAERLDIRKASIHYHFPSKADLGVAVVEAYAAALKAHMDAIAADGALTSVAMFERYCQPFRQLAATPDKICLCGALAGEILALPEAMRPVVKAFFAMHESWLEAMLARGIERAEVRADIEPAGAARLIFSSLQGALLVRRTADDRDQVEDVIATIKAQFLAPPA